MVSFEKLGALTTVVAECEMLAGRPIAATGNDDDVVWFSDRNRMLTEITGSSTFFALFGAQPLESTPVQSYNVIATKFLISKRRVYKLLIADRLKS